MALEAVLESIDDLSEGLKEHYVKGEDGKFRLDANGVDDLPSVKGMKTALEEIKTKATKRQEKIDELLATVEKFKDIDPEKAREAMKRVREFDDKSLLDEGKIDELLEKRTERMRADHENQLKQFNTKIEEYEKTNKALNAQLTEKVIHGQLRDAAIEAKVRPTAIQDIILRGSMIWQLKDGKAVPLRSDGQIQYGKNPNEPMTMAEWLEDLAKDAPHLFESSEGSGANNKRGSPGGTHKKRSEMTEKEKAEYLHEHGQDAFFKLPA